MGSSKLAVERGSLEGLKSSSLKLAAVAGAYKDTRCDRYELVWGYFAESDEDVEVGCGDKRSSSSSSEVDTTIWVVCGRVVVITDAILELDAALHSMWWLEYNCGFAARGSWTAVNVQDTLRPLFLFQFQIPISGYEGLSGDWKV